MTVAYYTFIVPSIATTPYPSPNIKSDKEYRRSQPSTLPLPRPLLLFLNDVVVLGLSLSL